MAFAPETGVESVRWDLAELYASPDDPRIEADLTEAQRFAEDFEARYRGRLGQLAPTEFLAMMTALEAALESGSRPAIYAQLKYSQDTGDEAGGRLLGRIRDAGARRGRHLVFFSLELAALDEEAVERLAAAPETGRYRHLLDRERMHRPHQLSEVEERLLTELDPVGTVSWTRLYSELCAAIRVSLAGPEVTLAEAITRLRDPDRERRREAAGAITAALDAGLRTRAYALNVVLLDKQIGDRMRRYPSWIADRNLANETSAAAAEALVTAVTGGYGLVARYYHAKRSLLGLGELSEWDRDAPVAEAGRHLSWAEARQIVLDAYASLSPRAAELVADFFDRGWIDAPPVPGKQSGAYCALGTPRLHPYVLVNFTGHLKDALTLAHELGHGLHYRLAARQHLFDCNPQLVLAETASVFGETLVFDHIMDQERDPSLRLSLLCQQVEDSIQAIFRQVAFNRFEDAAHRLRRERGELSVEQLGALWQEKLQAMFGDSLRLSPGHANWWSHVEHFVQTPGYVYAYAFGKLLALTLYRRWRAEGESFVDGYLEVLAAGGSRSPEATLATIGVNPEDPGFWKSGLDVFESMVAEVETLAGARPEFTLE